MGEDNCFMGDFSLPHRVIFFVNVFCCCHIISCSLVGRRFIHVILSYSEPTKNLLMECAAAHLKHKKFTSTYGSRLTSSSGRILLQSAPGWSQVLQNIIITFFVYFNIFPLTLL